MIGGFGEFFEFHLNVKGSFDVASCSQVMTIPFFSSQFTFIFIHFITLLFSKLNSLPKYLPLSFFSGICSPLGTGMDTLNVFLIYSDYPSCFICIVVFGLLPVALFFFL